MYNTVCSKILKHLELRKIYKLINQTDTGNKIMIGFFHLENPAIHKNSFQKLLLKLYRKIFAVDYVERMRQWGAIIGKDVFFENVIIDKPFASLLEIEDNVSMAFGRIFLHDAVLNNLFGLPIKTGKVILRKGATIGANVTILCGVEIGENAVVGACSLVTKDISANTFAFGVPAEVKGSIEDLKQNFLNRMKQDDPRFKYLDILPWRDRQKLYTREEMKKMYDEFICQYWS